MPEKSWGVAFRAKKKASDLDPFALLQRLQHATRLLGSIAR
jgi:hypothetical protein